MCARVSADDPVPLLRRRQARSRSFVRIGAQQRARVGRHGRRRAKHDRRDARDVLALQVAPDERNVLARDELAEDRAVQRRVQLGERQRLRAVAHLELVVEQALRDVRSEQRHQHRPLHVEHLLVDRDVDRRHAAAEHRARRRCRSR